ncbi:hypothetical protein MMC29_007789 [Sticta canariensis]|nr:hypothetical protein [Sticta canariensis]
MVERVIGTFQLLETIERNLYGDNSLFFLWRDSHIGEEIPHRDPDPTPEWGIFIETKLVLGLKPIPIGSSSILHFLTFIRMRLIVVASKFVQKHLRL